MQNALKFGEYLGELKEVGTPRCGVLPLPRTSQRDVPTISIPPVASCSKMAAATLCKATQPYATQCKGFWEKKIVYFFSGTLAKRGVLGAHAYDASLSQNSYRATGPTLQAAVTGVTRPTLFRRLARRDTPYLVQTVVRGSTFAKGYCATS
jgi:hypothetical protein